MSIQCPANTQETILIFKATSSCSEFKQQKQTPLRLENQLQLNSVFTDILLQELHSSFPESYNHSIALTNNSTDFSEE